MLPERPGSEPGDGRATASGPGVEPGRVLGQRVLRSSFSSSSWPTTNGSGCSPSGSGGAAVDLVRGARGAVRPDLDVGRRSRARDRGGSRPSAAATLLALRSRQREVPRGGAARALGRRAEEAPLDEAQDRRVVVDAVVDVARPRVRRRQDRGHAGTRRARSSCSRSARGALVGEDRRLHVVEEPAPLVVGEDEQPALPLRRRRERVEHLADEALAQADVALRVVVGAQVAAEPRRDRRRRWAACRSRTPRSSRRAA